MKTRIKNLIGCFLFAAILSAMIISGCGCSASKPSPDPLAGFHFSSLDNLHSNKLINDDFQDYLQKLPPEEKKYTGTANFLEDSTGRHAIVIEIDLKPNAWNHVLIYDSDNHRIKVIKYIDHKFRC